MAVVNVYAPHNLKDLQTRFDFYVQLDTVFRQCSATRKFIIGDLNARIGHCKRGEEKIIGQHGFGREEVHKVEGPNRDLLLEFCEASFQKFFYNCFYCS